MVGIRRQHGAAVTKLDAKLDHGTDWDRLGPIGQGGHPLSGLMGRASDRITMTYLELPCNLTQNGNGYLALLWHLVAGRGDVAEDARQEAEIKTKPNAIRCRSTRR